MKKINFSFFPFKIKLKDKKRSFKFASLLFQTNKLNYTKCRNGQICYTNNNDQLVDLPSTLKHYDKGSKIELSILNQELLNETENKINQEVKKLKKDLDSMQYKKKLIKEVGHGEQNALLLTIQGLIMLKGKKKMIKEKKL